MPKNVLVLTYETVFIILYVTHLVLYPFNIDIGI